MTKDDLKQIQKQVETSLLNFWDKVLEPVMATKEELKHLATKKDLEKLATKEELEEVKEELKEDINHVYSKADSIDRRLAAETSYRDRLEKRVVRVENKLDLPPHP